MLDGLDGYMMPVFFLTQPYTAVVKVKFYCQTLQQGSVTKISLWFYLETQLPWVMKAYPNTGHLTQQKKCFNYNLSKTRVTIEHSYGRLKGRWRCLLKRLDVDINDVPTIVTTCCVLHNMCELSGDLFMQDWLLEEDDQEPTSFPITVHAENSAVEIRDALTLYFSEQ